MPAQTRGFLFSDLRGYSAFVERHGDQVARELLARYRHTVREVVIARSGAEIRTEGDSFYVVFESVSDAIHAAIAIQQGLAAAGDPPIVAGIGIHAGEAEDSDEGIVSSAVNIAARICAVAPAGEILVSETVRALTRSYLRDVRFDARGQRRLKGITEPVRLYAVGDAGTARATPPPPRFRRVALIAAATVALVAATVAVAYVGGALTREGLAGQAPSGSSGPTRSALATGTSSPTSAEPSGTTGPRAPYPDAAEQALLARLPATMSVDTCVRADDDEVPSIPPFHEPGLVPLPVSAALRCPMGSGLSVFFYAAGRCDLVTACRSETETAVFSIASRRGVPEGECAEDAAALARWEFGDARGWVVCGDDTVWTYDDSNLLGRATSERPGVAYRWFHENARFPAD